MGSDCGFCKMDHDDLWSHHYRLENLTEAGQKQSMNRKKSPVFIRRSVLCVPGSNIRALAKIVSLGCDSVIFDLEDAVAPDMKQMARSNLAEIFNKSDMLCERIIRINPMNSIHAKADLDCVLALKPDAVLLPKTEEPQQIQDLSDLISDRDPMSDMRIWAMIETPRGVLNAAQIAEAGRTRDARLDCLVVGLNDLRKGTKVPKRPGRTYLVPWMMQIVLAGRAYGLDIIDAVSNDFKDLAAFEAECIQGKEMGFDGKMLIHPAQIDPANRTFAPDAEDIAEARAIVAAFAEPSALGQGAINLNGQMIERLHLDEAEQLLVLLEKVETKRTEQ